MRSCRRERSGAVVPTRPSGNVDPVGARPDKATLPIRARLEIDRSKDQKYPRTYSEEGCPKKNQAALRERLRPKSCEPSQAPGRRAAELTRIYTSYG